MRELSSYEHKMVSGGTGPYLIQSVAFQNALIGMAAYSVQTAIDPNTEITVGGMLTAAAAGVVGGAAGNAVSAIGGKGASQLGAGAAAISGGATNGLISRVNNWVETMNYNRQQLMLAEGMD